MKHSQVLTILTKHPWLIYGIDIVKGLSNKGFPKEDFINLAKIPKKLAKTLLYYLTRYDLLKRILINDKDFYIPTDNCLRAFKMVKRTALYKDKIYLYELKNMYVLIVLKRRRINTYTVSKEMIHKVKEVLKRERELSIDEMAAVLNMRKDVVIKILRILEVLGSVRYKMTKDNVKKYSIMKT
ncbi:MAG: hypothetical protein J7J99_04075 [Thermoprotei archaeon]|nr:hypothetical protein [Thermoprotei archaeon]